MAEFDYYEELKKSLEEAADYAKGNRSRCRETVRSISIPEYKASDVIRIRKSFDMTQYGLANILGVSKRTVEAWEAGKNDPSGAARHLLFLFDQDHTLVDRLIAR